MSSSSSQAKTTSTTTGAGLHPSPSRGSGQSPSGLSQLVNPSLPGSRLPPKLRKKILDLEYIEMAELLPESWQAVEETLSCCHQSGRRLKRAPVTDILTWLDCYATLVAVLCTVYAQFAPEFMAYQKTILKARAGSLMTPAIGARQPSTRIYPGQGETRTCTRKHSPAGPGQCHGALLA